MKEDKDKLIGTALARGLVQSGVRGEAGTDHPDPEAIAAVVEGMVQGDARDGILKHISACDTCYDTFLLTAELQGDIESEKAGSEKEKSKIIPFKPLALAASILIVIFSIYVFYRSGDIPKTPRELMEKSEAMKTPEAPESSADEFTFAKKSEPAGTAVMEEAPKKGGAAGFKAEKKAAPAPAPRKDKDFNDGLVEMEKERAIREKGDVHVSPGKRVGKSVSEARAAEIKDTEMLDREQGEPVQKQEAMQQVVRQRLTPDDFPPIQSRAVSLNMAVQQIPSYIPQKDIGKIFKETLTLSQKLGKEYEVVREEAKKTGNYSRVDSYVSGLSPLITVKTVGDTPYIAPNINWFLSRSDPQTVEHRFFALARFGWCDTAGFCYDLQERLRRSKRNLRKSDEKDRVGETDGSRVLLSEWQELHPGLKGIFKKVAHQTIVNLEKTQK